MTTDAASPADVAIAAIRSVEERDLDTLASLYDPEIEFCWPPGLSYSGTWRGPAVAEMSERFAALWVPLQPTTDEQQMDPEVIAGSDDTVVVEYTWRARDAGGRRFQTSTLGRYRVVGGRLADARMYYDDHAGLLSFVTAAAAAAGKSTASHTAINS